MNGRLIARGTVGDVIAHSGLTTFVIRGDNVRHLADRLRHEPGVEYVAFFGAMLHVSGQDRGSLERALAKVRGEQGIDVEEMSPSLEDVFIHLQEEEP
jgi:ABC-2 type transport system ATP-binding protein